MERRPDRLRPPAHDCQRLHPNACADAEKRTRLRLQIHPQKNAPEPSPLVQSPRQAKPQPHHRLRTLVFTGFYEHRQYPLPRHRCALGRRTDRHQPCRSQHHPSPIPWRFRLENGFEISHENEKGLTQHVDVFDRYVIHHQFIEDFGSESVDVDNLKLRQDWKVLIEIV